MVAMLEVAADEQLHHVAVVGVATIAPAALVGGSVPGFNEIGDITVALANLKGHAPLGNSAHGIANRAAIEAALYFRQEKIG